MTLTMKTPWRGLGAASITVAAVVVALAAAAPAHAATPTCATAWSAATVYTGGSTASENGTNFKANWWTQGDDPATQSGAAGSGKPWTNLGACTGGTGGGDTGGGGTGGGGTGTGGGGTGGGGTGSASGILFSPYKDVTVNMNWNTNVIRTAVTGSVIPIVGASNSLVSTAAPKLGAITLAFATGTC